MATISIPLNEDRPPKDAVAQQNPNFVVGRKTNSAIGSVGVGETKSLKRLKCKSTDQQLHQNKNQKGALVAQ
jgi:hypothetical protein